jgi:hypothetical protein
LIYVSRTENLAAVWAFDVERCLPSGSKALDIHPQWRGFWYFVVGDEIIIVDRNHKIVAVLAV